MDRETKIIKNAQRTETGGLLHKGTNYRQTTEGLQAVASMNPKAVKEMGIEDFGVPGDGKAVFDYGFGMGAMGLSHKHVFQDPAGFGLAGEVDVRPQLKQAIQWQMKAMSTTTGGDGTAGYALVPVYVDPRIIDQTRKYTPFVELTPRVANQGNTADYNKLTAKGSAAYKAEDSSQGEQTDTYDRASSPIKYGYSVGRVTGPMIASMPPYQLPGFLSFQPYIKHLPPLPFSSCLICLDMALDNIYY